MENTIKTEQVKNSTRYMQILLLTAAGGAIYPMLYLRQIYQDTMLHAFNITNVQLGELYSIMGLLFFICYTPSGWLADRVKPMKLITLSLLGTGLLGLWYSTLPSYTALLIIFSGWGVTTGLTFWGAVMKRIKLLAAKNEAGRFYGIYDGGRGLVESILASIALFIFSVTVGPNDKNVVQGLVYVIHMYSWFCIALAIVCFVCIWFEGNLPSTTEEKQPKTSHKNVIKDLGFILRQPEVWLIAIIISSGYHLFWSTYSFSGYLQAGGWGFTAVMAGTITTIKLWLRPIGGVAGGFLGDKLGNIRVLTYALILSALGLVGLICIPATQLPSNVVIGFCVFFILFVGLLTYAVRGLYWAIIENLKVPENKLGLAIGVISAVGYCPDIFIPLINGYIMDYAPNQETGYQLYFGYTVVMACFGIVACFVLKHRVTAQPHHRVKPVMAE
ncbi:MULTISPECIES: nitrate/nitrite transporter [unclassified Serratia (in: enterobacteria)]|uniref:MFS transporter n=1 Tax=unclassified Serratia (in: enterobacteria) TaxID=2647522 RepID=UPI0009079FF5|nr:MULTISPECIES: MFS transporter [unclassified Serratia (in: enterobacteria)]